VAAVATPAAHAAVAAPPLPDGLDDLEKTVLLASEQTRREHGDAPDLSNVLERVRTRTDLARYLDEIKARAAVFDRNPGPG
jgi:hypothetical protein